MSEPVTELSSGQVFAGWRIERELARGGMGVLYLAHHPRLPRTDVIKVLSPMLSTDQRFRERFLREVTRMSTLSHPHLMTIHDSGESPEGTLYLVMPYVAGGDLRALLKQGGPLPPARAAKLVSQLAAGLDAAHRVGVVHRDVKPENVLLASVEPEDSDHALLTDFGISREDMATNTLTATGELLLTPAYASPEQVLGGMVDARADQYALACILYELLTGEPPYRNDVQVVMLMAHVQEPIPKLAARLGLPPAIDEVIARGMAKSPQERFENCRALAQAATAALGVTTEVKQPDVDVRETRLAPAPTPIQRTGPTGPPPQGPPPSAPPGYQQQPSYQRQPGYQQQPVYQQQPGYQNAPAPQSTPYFPAGPPQQPKRGKRRLLIALLAVVVAAGVGVGVVLGTSGSKGGGSGASGTSSSKATSAFTALLDRVPQSIRGTCADMTATVAAPMQPFVATLADCHTTVGGAAVIIDYRTLNGDDAAIQHYRTELLGLGGKNHSPGNCQTFDSTDPTHHGTRGFAQVVDQPPLVGALWCDTDGTLWYLQTSPATGSLPIMTEVRTAADSSHAAAEARYNNLIAIAPTS